MPVVLLLLTSLIIGFWFIYVACHERDLNTLKSSSFKFSRKHYFNFFLFQETNRLEYLIPKKSSLRHRLPMGDQGFIDFVAHLLEVNPKKRPSASEALKHPWLSYPYEPISAWVMVKVEISAGKIPYMPASAAMGVVHWRSGPLRTYHGC